MSGLWVTCHSWIPPGVLDVFFFPLYGNTRASLWTLECSVNCPLNRQIRCSPLGVKGVKDYVLVWTPPPPPSPTPLLHCVWQRIISVMVWVCMLEGVWACEGHRCGDRRRSPGQVNLPELLVAPSVRKVGGRATEKGERNHGLDLDPGCVFGSCVFWWACFDSGFIQVSGAVCCKSKNINILCIDSVEPTCLTNRCLPSFYQDVVSDLGSRCVACWDTDILGRHGSIRPPWQGDGWIDTWRHQSSPNRGLPRRWYCSYRNLELIDKIIFDFSES